MRAFEYHEFLGWQKRSFKILAVSSYRIYTEQYGFFPIIHSGVLRLSEDRVRINIEYINL